MLFITGLRRAAGIEHQVKYAILRMRMPYAYAYALVKTRLYSHLRLSYYHSIIDSIDTRFIQYLSFYFSTSFPKIMFWLFTEVYKKIMSNDLRSKDMISPLRIHAVGLFQACSLFLTRKKKAKKLCLFTTLVLIHRFPFLPLLWGKTLFLWHRFEIEGSLSPRGIT